MPDNPGVRHGAGGSSPEEVRYGTHRDSAGSDARTPGDRDIAGRLSSEFAALTVLENLLVAVPAQRGEALWQAAPGKRYWQPQERAGNLGRHPFRSRGASVLRDQVQRRADLGTGVLLVEQKAFEALGVSDWAYILVAGRVEIAGAASEILGRPDIREVFLGQPGTDSPAAQSP